LNYEDLKVDGVLGRSIPLSMLGDRDCRQRYCAHLSKIRLFGLAPRCASPMRFSATILPAAQLGRLHPGGWNFSRLLSSIQMPASHAPRVPFEVFLDPDDTHLPRRSSDRTRFFAR